jgi:pimeloyl-ACP methyl ester carboxylesterase
LPLLSLRPATEQRRRRTAARGGAIVYTDLSRLPLGTARYRPASGRPVVNVNGTTVHILETGYETPGRPAVLRVHGVPELAYRWRNVLLPLAAAATTRSSSGS